MTKPTVTDALAKARQWSESRDEIVAALRREREQLLDRLAEIEGVLGQIVFPVPKTYSAAGVAAKEGTLPAIVLVVMSESRESWVPTATIRTVAKQKGAEYHPGYFNALFPRMVRAGLLATRGQGHRRQYALPSRVAGSDEPQGTRDEQKTKERYGDEEETLPHEQDESRES